jgi:uncharacterized protein YcgI (DUF1989 family)
MTQILEEHHSRAADHFEFAAENHREAERAYAAGDIKTAAYHAHLATGHAVQAHDHADLAAMTHVEYHDLLPGAGKKAHKH